MDARSVAARWDTFTRRNGDAGPLTVPALSTPVRAKDERHRVGPEEGLVVFRTVGVESRACYGLSSAGRETPLAHILPARNARPRVEQMFQDGNGEVGLDHCEVRSWIGRHHHTTLSLGPIVNSTATESAPVLARVGRTLYFYSERPGGLGKADLWMSRRVPKAKSP